MMDTGFLWILLAGLIYGAIHSAFTSTPVKKWITVQLGLENPYAYRFVYVLQSIFFTFIYLFIVFFLPDANLYIIPAPWVYLTTIIETAAAVCAFLSLMQTGILAFLGLSIFIDGEANPDQLNTKGFYRYMRHPLYFFTLLALWLLPFMTWNILAFNIGVSVYMIVGAALEERKLILEYGKEYIDYKKQVPAFWPKFVR
jgi:protein-S-isoprenylcysteine O-methyltransferase Ste14